MKTNINLFTIKLFTVGLFQAALGNAHGQATFSKVTTGDIVNDTGHFTSPAWGDFNNDGFLDLFVSNYENSLSALYQNNGDGSFTTVTQVEPVMIPGYYAGTALGDYDNDGLLDLLVAAPSLGAPSPDAVTLYHNNGDGTFSTAPTSVLTNEFGRFIAPAWADYDNDGWLDLIVTDPTGKNLLYHNNGNGTFAKVISGPVANDRGFGVAAAWADYDNDGFPDLFVANDSSGNLSFLYHNNGNGTFTRITSGPVATDRGLATTAVWGDYNNDGLLDLFVTSGDDPNNRLYRNNGNGTFTKITSGPELGNPPGVRTEGASWGDFDNDGYLDLFVAHRAGTNSLFHNNGDGTFSQVESGAPVDEPAGDNFSCGWVDYDNDGFLDLFVTRGVGANDPQTNLLYHNERNGNHWLKVRCVGTLSNRSAIGTKVRVKATIGGRTFWQLREITGGDGGLNAVPLLAHFGLGDATNATVVRLEWPSGAVQEFANVGADQSLTLVEAPRLEPLGPAADGSFQLSLIGAVGYAYDLQTSPDLLTWIPWLSLTNTSRTMSLNDTNVNNVTQRFYRSIGR